MNKKKGKKGLTPNNSADQFQAFDLDWLFDTIFDNPEVDINPIVRSFLPMLSSLLEQAPQAGVLGEIFGDIRPFIPDLIQNLSRINFNELIPAAIGLIPQIQKIVQSVKKGGLNGLDFTKFNLIGLIKPLIPTIRIIYQSQMGVTLFERSMNYAILAEDKITAVRSQALNESQFNQDDTLLEIREAIRCKMHCANHLRSLLKRSIGKAVMMIFPALTEDDFLDMFSKIFGSKVYKKMNSLMSYIQPEIYLASFVFDSLESIYQTFKEEKVDIRAEIEKLIPTPFAKKQELIDFVTETRRLIIQYSDQYFSFENQIARAIVEQGQDREKLLSLQKEIFENVMLSVEKVCKDDLFLSVSVSYDHFLIRESFRNPIFQAGRNLNDYANQIVSLANRNPFVSSIVKFFASQAGQEFEGEDFSDLTQMLQHREDVQQKMLEKYKALQVVKQQHAEQKAKLNDLGSLVENLCKTGDLAKIKEELEKLREENPDKVVINHRHLFWACKFGHDKVVAYLCKNNRQLFDRKNEGNSVNMKKCLMGAAKAGHLKVIKVLENVANLRVKLTEDEIKLIQDETVKKYILQKQGYTARKTESKLETIQYKKPEPSGEVQQVDDLDQKACDEIRQYFKNAESDLHDTISLTIHKLEEISTELKFKKSANYNDLLNSLGQELTSQKNNFQTLLAREQAIFLEFKQIENNDQWLQNAKPLRKRHLKMINHFEVLSGTLTKIERGFTETQKLIELELSKKSEQVSSPSDFKDSAPAKKSKALPEEKAAVLLKDNQLKALVPAKSKVVESKAVQPSQNPGRNKTQAFFRGKSNQNTIAGYVELAEQKLPVEKLFEDIIFYTNFQVNDLAKLPKEQIVVFQRIQFTAIYFKIMVLLALQPELFPKLRINLSSDEARKIRNAMNHPKGFIKEVISPEECLDLHTQMMVFSNAFIDAAKSGNCDNVRNTPFYKGAMAQGEILEAKIEKVTPDDRFNYTISTGSQRLLFSQFKLPNGQVLPENLRIDALRMVQIKAQIYAFYSPYVFADEAVVDRHPTIQNVCC